MPWYGQWFEAPTASSAAWCRCIVLPLAAALHHTGRAVLLLKGVMHLATWKAVLASSNRMEGFFQYFQQIFSLSC